MEQGTAQAVTDNRAKNRFELAVGNQTVFADYRRNGQTMVISYVEAPPSLRGTGAAGRLMEGVMDAARSEGLKIVPLCSYAALWMRRNRRHDDLLA
ncbi:GNAT family N-acetyltransferase [Azospirillum picis]|uniref:GNAT family acetyltransferase n=1 Tax=Azospirillum picis TaxID=488438 RepID=A0ABU0MCU0_9PROT|nr:GNAT family N-acetyltransferase [Azospirillum picis]MBP2297726.1 putative GNAT family acetyltransferase [Azospirillum picis]MDQ0531251.1 putative GNAT family acetyltransferase [Azospirillum picis]